MLVVKLFCIQQTFQCTKADVTMGFKVLGLRRFLRRTSESRSQGRPDDMITLIIVTRHFCSLHLETGQITDDKPGHCTARISLSHILCLNNVHISCCMNGLGFTTSRSLALNFLFICCDQILTLFVCCVLKWLLLCGCWLIFVKTAPSAPENIAIYRLSSFLKQWLLFAKEPQSQRANCNWSWQ